LVPYNMLEQIFALSGKEKPKIDCDILVSMYLVNASSSTRYIRELTASVEVDGKRTNLEPRSNFFLNTDDDDRKPQDMEYVFEAETGKEGTPLQKLFPDLPCEAVPQRPFEGWLRYIIRDVVPEQINSNTWHFIILDSMGNQQFITKVSQTLKVGEITLRPKGFN